MSWADVVKHSTEQLCANKNSHQTENDAEKDESHAFTDDQPQHISTLSSERETNSNFVRALCHGVAHHPKNSARGQEERDSGK